MHKQTGKDALKGARNELLLYRSKDLSGKVTAVSGSVAIPKGKAPKGGWPIITYAHGTTGAADACAPTKGYDKDKLTSYAFPLLKRWIKAGYAVVRTDYDGLGTPGVHQYLVGTSEGRSVLDAVRAARAFDGKLSKRYMIAGHSQGGHAALFAAAAAPKYLPELKLRGTVAFAPASHLKSQFQLTTLASSAPGGGLGRDRRARPARDRQLRLQPGRAELSDAGRAGAVPADQDGLLRRAEQADLVRRPAAQRHPQVRARTCTALLNAVGESDPEHLRMKTPVRIEQGTADGTVIPAFTQQLVDEYKQNGVSVVYKTYDGVSHGGVVDAAAKDSTTYINSRLK